MARRAVKRCWRGLSVHARECARSLCYQTLLMSNSLFQYADIRQVLWDMAVSLGTKIIPEAEISSLDLVDDGRCSVRLASGEVLEADVIIGTDGPGGIARKEVIGQEVKETTLGMSIFR